MDKIYFSAVIHIRDGVTPVVGAELEQKENFSFDDYKREFQFIIERYFGFVKIIAFGEITKKEFYKNTNIKLTDM